MEQKVFLVVWDSDNEFNRCLSLDFVLENPRGTNKIHHEESGLETIP